MQDQHRLSWGLADFYANTEADDSAYASVSLYWLDLLLLTLARVSSVCLCVSPSTLWLGLYICVRSLIKFISVFSNQVLFHEKFSNKRYGKLKIMFFLIILLVEMLLTSIHGMRWSISLIFKLNWCCGQQCGNRLNKHINRTCFCPHCCFIRDHWTTECILVLISFPTEATKQNWKSKKGCVFFI